MDDSCDDGECAGTPKVCDDGLYCNGVETCDAGTGDCLAGTPPDLADSIDCTVDKCDEENNAPLHSPNDTLCDDGDVCTDDSCDAQEGCQFADNQAGCDDLDPCTTDDACDDGECAGTPKVCDDGLYCNGVETCDAVTGDCLEGTPPDIADTVDCTVDECDEENDAPLHSPDDTLCDDADLCTTDLCLPDSGCDSQIVEDQTPCSDNPQEVCVAGQCTCVPACGGKECGPDGCGDNCGGCDDPGLCATNECDEEAAQCIFESLPAATACGDVTCSTVAQTTGMYCDGKGECSLDTYGCDSYLCDDAAGSCYAACEDDGPCATDFYCAEGDCELIDPPVVDVLVDQECGYAPLELSFQADLLAGKAIEEYVWDFGDGTISQEQMPTHTFVVPGTHEVTLTALGGGGEGTASRTVTVNGLRWLSPSPTGEDLSCVFGVDDDHVFMGGENGAVLLNGKLLPAPTNQDITGIWGNSPTNVFVVAGGGQGGSTAEVFRWNGEQWGTELSTDQAMTFRSVFGDGAGNVHAVGPAAHWFDGETWSDVSPENSWAMWDVWCDADGACLAVGSQGRSWEWDGAAWVENAPIEGSPHVGAVWKDRAVGGADIYCYNGNGSWWKCVTSLPWWNLVDVTEGHLLGSHNVFSQSGQQEAETWSSPYYLNGLTAAWEDSEGRVYIVGNRGQLNRHPGPIDWYTNASGARMDPAFTSNSITDVFPIDDLHLVLGTNGGTAALWTEGTWTQLQVPWGENHHVLSVGGLSAGDLLISEGQKFTGTGGTKCGTVKTGTTELWRVTDSWEKLTNIWSPSFWVADMSPLPGGQLFLANVNLVWSGNGLEPIGAGYAAKGGCETDVWSSSASNIYMAYKSWNYEVWRHDGSQWNMANTGIGGSTPLHDVWASGPGDVYVASNKGLFHFNGQSWQQTIDPLLPENTIVYSVCGTAPNDVFASVSGKLVHFDGFEWEAIDVPTNLFGQLECTADVAFGRDSYRVAAYYHAPCCIPECDGKCDGEPDGCGKTCVCFGPLDACVDGECICQPACDGKDCGPDGCGGSCDECGANESCAQDGLCECDFESCGGPCCAESEICFDDTCCLPDCNGKDCGTDGCGGTCGACDPGQVCIDNLCPPPGLECDDGNEVAWDGCTNGMLSEFRVNISTPDHQRFPDVATTLDGGFVIVWEEEGTDPNKAFEPLRGNMYDAAGEMTHGPLTLASGSFTHLAPSVDAFSDGGFVLAWTRKPGNSTDIQANLFNAQGGNIMSQFPVNTDTPGSHNEASVTSFSDDSFIVVWSAYWAGNWFVTGKRFGPDGSAVGNEFVLNDYSNEAQNAARVAPFEDDSFVVAWHGDGPGDSVGIFAQMFDAEAEPEAGQIPVNNYQPDPQFFPDVATQTSGGFVVAWMSMNQGEGDWGVRARLFDNEGNPTSSDLAVNAHTEDAQEYPSVAVLNSDRFVVVWNGAGADDTQGIFGQLYTSNGETEASNFRVNEHTPGQQSNARVASFVDGSFAVVWMSVSADGSNWDIHAQRFNADGTRMYH